MALSFISSSDIEVTVVITCDSSVEATDEQRAQYLNTGDLNDLGKVGDSATRFTIKALSPSERERAEVAAGAYTRSELGRFLWIEAPTELKDRARWHHELEDDEKIALAQYNEYINRVYVEMIRESLVKIDDEITSVDSIDLIRPESARAHVVSELVVHIQRLSTLDPSGK